MLIRYKNGADGPGAVAQVYSTKENGIDRNQIDRNAVGVVKRLNAAGYESYIVGGAVRDLILGRKPKDFDVATSASPRQVHKLFYNSRIIGRRFRLVHITFGEDIIEVSTFRSNKDHESTDDNHYGTIEEDCKRRDFTINSLYYDPIKGDLIDFNDAMNDFREKRIVSLIPLNRTFNEDPVRMIRAVKYSVTTGFRIPFRLGRAIKRYAPAIGGVSSSRLTEEVNKILACGNSSEIFRKLNYYKLLAHMLPAVSVYASFPQLFDSLQELDVYVNSCRDDGTPINRERMYLALSGPFISRNDDWGTPMETFSDILRQIKVLINPITPPNYELEAAAALYMTQNGLRVPKGAVRTRRQSPAQSSAKPAQDTRKKRRRRSFVRTKPEREG